MASTEIVLEHYQRPEVKATILRWCMDGANARALNADEHWYKSAEDINDTVMLRGPADYDATIERGRTLYATLDILEQAVFEQDTKWNRERNEPETTLGDLANCMAFTLSTDIDSLGDIRRDLSVKEAVEDAAQFHVDYLREKGIEKSVYCLYSGGGIYVHVHHGLFAVQADTELTPEDRGREFSVITKAYNRLIEDISQAFFRKYPQHIGKVKFDALNNQKRTFKTIFSIHKRHPFAVIPLDPKNIKIDFSRASLPLSDEVLAEGANWYQTFDPSEKKATVALLKDKMEEVKQHIRDAPDEDRTISKLPEPLELAKFASCMQNIIEKAQPTEGRHRALGILATYLYQMGWDEDAAFGLWSGIADRCGVEARIFDTEFGRVSCPRCDTIQTGTGGYPSLNLNGMGFCVTDEHCKGCIWPGDYHYQKILNEMEPPETSDTKDEEPIGPTVLTALQKLLDNEDKITGECSWNWRLHKPRIRRALRGQITAAGEKIAHKFLKQFKQVLKDLGIDYFDLYPLILKPKDNKEEFAPEIKAKALDVLKNGDPVQYIVDGCSSMVIGAENAFKKLICCISTQNIKQSAGLHPKLNGESSGGKTFTVYTFAHHMPSEAVIKGSMSAKAGFYHHDGNRVFRILDDYQAGNEDLDTTIKQTSSEFHSAYKHRTVVNQMAAVLEIGSEQTWAITSVDSSQEVQVLNRQLPINVDDSVETTKLVNDRTIERYCDGERQYPVNETVLVSRCILQTLRDEGYINIRIPFKDRIEWLDTSNRRNPSIFMDLVIAHTAMFRHQREKDSEGYYLATIKDFQAARGLFSDKDGEELVKKLSKREKETLEFLVANPTGITQSDLAEHLKVSRQRAAEIIYGQKGVGGLQAKVAISETKISDTIRISDDERKTVHKTLYSLKDYDRFAGFDAVVRLKTQADESGNPHKDNARGDARGNTGKGSNDASNVIIKERKREKRESGGGNVGVAELSPEKEENPCNPCMISPDNDMDPCPVLAPPLHDPTKEANDSDMDSCAVSDSDIAMFRRIYARSVEIGSPTTPGQMAILLRANDHDIGIDACIALIEAEIELRDINARADITRREAEAT